MKWLETELSNEVYYISLNRPEVRNAFNPELITEITQTFQTVPDNARVVVLKGKGKVFCSGADLEWMKSMKDFTLEENKQDSLDLYSMFNTIRNCEVPVIAVVQGAAMGGALGLIACADIVLAEENTQFCFSEVRLGLAPAVISSFVLNKTNLGLAGPYMISGKVFGSKEAMAMGLIHSAGALDAIEKNLREWIQSFLDAAPVAVRETKKLISELSLKPIEDQKHLTTTLIASRRVSDEGQEGLNSFLTKRQPKWKVSLP